MTIINFVLISVSLFAIFPLGEKNIDTYLTLLWVRVVQWSAQSLTKRGAMGSIPSKAGFQAL